MKISDNTEHYLKMSVINAVFTIKKYQKMYPKMDINDIINLIEKVGSYISVYDYSTARVLFTKFDFSNLNNIRDYISQILISEWPGWILQVPFGRELVASSFIDNEYFDIYQCFKSAGLFNKHADEQIIYWWDRLSGIVRNQQNEEKLKTGRVGELLTLDYERKKLSHFGLEPKWVAIDNNFAGYDVLSYNFDGNERTQIMIEVKTSNSLPVTFYVTKNEWKIAKDIGDRYFFYIWYLPKKELHKFKVNDIEPSIPFNRGNGEWQNVLIKIEEPLNG